jgi:hypothetical protein
MAFVISIRARFGLMSCVRNVVQNKKKLCGNQTKNIEDLDSLNDL